MCVCGGGGGKWGRGVSNTGHDVDVDFFQRNP